MLAPEGGMGGAGAHEELTVRGGAENEKTE